MAELQFVKGAGGMLRPANQSDADAMQKVRNGSLISGEFKQPRNPLFHRKYFALLNLAYEYWTPPEVNHKGMPASKNFDKFREDIQVAAGHYEVVVNIKGEARARSKSISFASMADDEFNTLYRSVFSACWKLVMSKIAGMTETKMEEVINELLRFD